MIIELPIITDIFSSPDKTGVRKLITKDKVINRLFDINEIEVEEFINPKTGNVIKKYTGVYSNEVYYKVNAPYTELKDLKINRTYPIKGFMGHSKKYK
jgi:hypothetical protein